MKQKIYILGMVIILMIFAAALMKVNHIAGAGILMVTGIFLLVIVFLPLALVNHYMAQGGNGNLLLHIVTWITCLVVFGSMLFKIMHWPGAGRIILLALPFPYIVFLPVFLVTTARIKNFSIFRTIFVLFLLVFLSVLSALLALNVSVAKIGQSMLLSSHYQSMEKINADLEENLPDAGSNIGMDQLSAAADQVVVEARSIKEMLYNSIQADGGQLQSGSKTAAMLSSRILAAKVLQPEDDQGPAARLELAMRDLLHAMRNVQGGDSLVVLAARVLQIDTSEEPDPSWRRMMFENAYLSWVLTYLESVEANTSIMEEAFIAPSPRLSLSR
jgi:hypothetical protein